MRKTNKRDWTPAERDLIWRIDCELVKVANRNASFADHACGDVAGSLDNITWREMQQALGCHLVDVFVANARGIDIRVAYTPPP